MRRRSSRVLTGLLVACLGIGSLANGYQAKAVSSNRGYQDDVATYGFQVASHPGTKVYLNSELKGYVLDTWCYINSRWSHEWVTANGGVTSTDDCPVELKLGEDNHRNYVYPERITDLPEEFSVVIKEYYQGRQVKTFTEYSTEYDISKEYPSESFVSAWKKGEKICLGTYGPDSVSYIYEIYSPESMADNENISFELGDAQLTSQGKMYINDKNKYYIAEFPEVKREKVDVTSELVGWFDAPKEGKEYSIGDTISKGTKLYPHWKESVRMYDVKYIDIVQGANGKKLGERTVRREYGKEVFGEELGMNQDAGSYYIGYRCVGATKDVVKGPNTVVYRYFQPEEYDVNYVDIIKGGEKDGTILNSKIQKMEFGQMASGGALGTIDTVNAYYNGYQYAGCSEKKVSTGGTVVYRYFKPGSYRINFDGNGATAGNVKALTDCKYANHVVLPKNTFEKKVNISLKKNAEQVTGELSDLSVSQKFLGWSDKKNGAVKYKDGDTVSDIAKCGSEITLYAVWGEEKVKISTKVEKKGYTLCGFSENAAAKTGSFEYTVKNPMTLYAIWKMDTYTIQYDCGTYKIQFLDVIKTSYTYKQDVFLPNSSQMILPDGYAFVGWYLKGDTKQTIVSRITSEETGNKVFCPLLKKVPAASQNPSAGNTPSQGKNENQTPAPEAGNSQKPQPASSAKPQTTESTETVPGNTNGYQQNTLSDKETAVSLKTSSSYRKGTVFTKSNIKYQILSTGKKGGTLKVLKFAKNLKKLVIPSKIKLNGLTYTVTAIGNKAFYKCTKLTQITIPNTVKTLGKQAFASCSSLKSVKIGKNVHTIGKDAFYGCKKLVTVKLYSTKCKSIAKNAFNCKNSKCKIYVSKKMKKKYGKMIKASNKKVKYKILTLK